MLTLKYRPKTIGDLIGQDSVRETLEHAFNNNKLANAYLLTGPRGAGKTSTARIIAKSINCQNKAEPGKPTLEPCGTCSSCVNIANSNDLDVIEIEAASHGHVEDARSLIEKASLAAINSDYKIYIIDEVHMLSNAAFNALLKLFEEPPHNVIFILATTEAHKVLPTITSRCQQFRFKPISVKDCENRLKEICSLENFNINDAALEFIAEESEGAMRDALSILEQISVYCEDAKEIDKALVERILGKVSQHEIIDLLNAIYTKSDSDLLTKLNAILEKNSNPNIIAEELFQNSISILNSICLNETDEKFSVVKNSINENNIPKSELVYISEELSKLDSSLRQTTQANKLLQTLCLKLCFREDFITLKELKDRLERIESGSIALPQSHASHPVNKPSFNTAPAAPKAQPVAKEAATAAITRPVQESAPAITEPITQASNPEPEKKSGFVDLSNPDTRPSNVSSSSNDFVSELSPSCKGLFISSKASLQSISGSVAIIHIPERFKFLKTKLEAKSPEVISAINKTSGENIAQINFELSSGAPAETNTYAPKPKVELADSSQATNTQIQTNAPAMSNQTEQTMAQSPQPYDSGAGFAPSAAINDNSVQAGNENTDTCCDREAALDEVLQAGISIFGGSVLEE